MDKQVCLIVGVVLLVIASVLANGIYQKEQDRQAYYACLKLSEKITAENNNSNRYSLSLPYCRN